MPDTMPSNEIILASAGSGKTFALVIRFLKLLRSGVPPERIVALTFTRKAAGEFTDRILRRLLDAARDDTAALALHADLTNASGPPLPLPSAGFTAAALRTEFTGLLETLAAALPRIFLGTLDSFFARLLRCHPLEFGLDSDFAIAGTDEFDRQTHFNLAAEALFHGGLPASFQQQFIQSFDLATFGWEEKSIREKLEKFVTRLHALWLDTPDPSRWGERAAIVKSPWFLRHAQADPVAEGKAFLSALAKQKLQPRQRKKLGEFVEELAARIPGTPLGKSLEYMMHPKRLGDSIRGIGSGEITILVHEPLTLNGDACRALEALVGRVVADEMEVACRRTKGIWEVIRVFEEQWDRLVRSRGRLDFSDITYLLGGGPFGGASPALSLRPPLAGEARLWIDYRTDSQFDHWMLDEFQDTSLKQWRVMENLIDEAIQDSDGRGRSYFQVGDVKQAIYGWRGGCWQLTEWLAQHYSITPGSLTKSYRSAQPVIDTVNRIFGDIGVLNEMVGEVAPQAVEWWAKWPQHQTAKTGLPGFAAVIRPVAEEEADAFEQRMLAVEALLRDIQPIDRGLSCAILFRCGEDVQQAAEWLRSRPDLPLVLSEMDVSQALDNPLTLALLSLLQLAAHPGDSLARQHLEMTPLGEAIRQDRRILTNVPDEITRHGFAAWATAWLERLQPFLGEPDAFTASRIAHFRSLAGRFDARGDRDIDAFLTFCKTTTTRETASPNAVQIMTIHKAKGLEFDVVFLPLSKHEDGLAEADTSLLTSGTIRNGTQWILDSVDKWLASSVDELSAARSRMVAEHCYEGCCVFYVAVTRAARGLYFIAEASGEKSVAKTPLRWVNTTLCGDSATPLQAAGIELEAAYACGDERWFESVSPAPPPAAAPTATPAFIPAQDAGHPRLARRTPSGSERTTVTAELLFSRGGSEARQRGTLMHALLEQVDWTGKESRQRLSDWFQENHPQVGPFENGILQQARQLLENPAVKPLFERPQQEVTLWRERSFECILDDEWITGTFDRVVIHPDSARIIDFKTDDLTAATVSEKAKTYAPQLELYRRVLSRLLALPESAITATLVFTVPGVLVEAVFP